MALLNYFELNRFSIVALPFQVQSGIRPTIEYYDLCKKLLYSAGGSGEVQSDGGHHPGLQSVRTSVKL